LSDTEWAGYLFYRENPRGLLNERWVHSYGCGQWFELARDTVTHEIKHSAPLEDLPGPHQVSDD
jgi:sarcosine oxidase subunit delta